MQEQLATYLDIIAQLHRLVARDPSLRLEQEELLEIDRRVRESLLPGADPESRSLRLLPEFLNRNPRIYEWLVTDLTQALLECVNRVVGYHRELSLERPLTDEEKKLGKELREHLLAALELLKTVGWRPKDAPGTEPTQEMRP